jgi:acyl-CoA thioesterase-1
MGSSKLTFKTAFDFIAALLLVLITNTASANEKILIWGDSLSAAYGISVDSGWVSLLKKELENEATIINGSISGETTQGGLTRLPAALITHQPDVVVIELGANDGLRGFPPQTIKANLKRMINKSQKAGAQVILLGMKIPPNYGKLYSDKFEAVFAELAREFHLSYIPFFLENIIGNRRLLQEDELHPTAAAQPLLLKEILPTINKVLEEDVKQPASQ